MTNQNIYMPVTLTLFLFLISLLLYPLDNDRRFALAKEPAIVSSSSNLTNQSNGILGAIASNLFANNPDAVVGGYHPPSSNTSNLKKSEAITKGLFNNDHKFALTLQQQNAIPSSTTQSNRVLGAIASNLWADNSDAVVGGYHRPIYNASESKPDAPAKEKGFLVTNEKLVNISYPSSWIKNKATNMQFTGVHSTPIISFLIPDFEASTRRSNFVGIAKYIIGGNSTAAKSLSNYVIEELKELESDGSFHLYESHPDRIGQHHSLAQRMIYATNIIDSSPASGAEVIGHRKTMEVITVNNGTAYLFVYSANANKYPVYLADVIKMLNSIQL
jgi:hypothetical protein